MLLASHQPWVDWSWVGQHRGLIRHELWEHVLLTVLAVGLGLVIATAMAALTRAWRPLTGVLLSLCGVIYAIPSIALFALLVPITGFTTTTSEIGLVGYTLLILLRNLLAGLDSVPAEVKDAARGMGYGPLRLLIRVELPLALPALFAGVRIAAVTTIGLVTVTSLIGQGGLGYFLLDGFQRDFRTEELLGAVLAVVLAFGADLGIVGIQRLTTPWSGTRAS
ncbi:MAG TPA: ABC transporter permease [Acidimicrobiales bacterium]|jgi:osmoprotectant transport system permease protein|nr:ABC transporter permease [Acidimicrobiales bacterium]